MLSKILKARPVVQTAKRGFAAQGVLTQELTDHLNRLGFDKHERFVQNPT